MKLLLDTHIWLWSVLEPDRVGKRVSSMLVDPDNELWLSPVSIWEALTLARKNRVALNPDPISWVQANLRVLAFHEAQITHEVALQSGRLNLAHGDPADALLAATAQFYGLTLVTADRRLLDCPDVPTLAND